MADKESVVPTERIESRIFLIRGEKVLLDQDLADLYEVETKVLVQAVKRNVGRFPADFMFQLTPEEFENLRSQIVTSSRGGRRMLADNAELSRKLAALEGKYDQQFKVVFDAIRALMKTEVRPRRQIGFVAEKDI